MTADIPDPQGSGGAAIQLEEIRKTYGNVVVLDGVDLDIRSGEFLTLLGASGSGKSTLLNVIAGFIKPDSGGVTVDGVDLTAVPTHKRGLGMVFQDYALFPHMSVNDNVAYPLRRKRIGKKDITARVAEALEMVDMGELGSRRPAALSGGQRQRVALARAIVSRPKVLLMDEPLGALDKLLRDQLQLEIRRLHQEIGITFVFVTHDQEEALTMSDRIAVLRDGQIEQLGAPREIYDRPANRYVAEFIGMSNIFEANRSGEIAVGDGARFRIPAGAPSGTTALMVRPESIRLAQAGAEAQPDDDGVEAIVEDSVYLGSDLSVHLRLANGQRIVARTGVGGGAQDFAPGTNVFAHWSVEDARGLA